MALLFIVILIIGTLTLRVLLTSHTHFRINIPELARLSLLGYALVFLCGVPPLCFNSWSLAHHTLTMGVATALGLLACRRKKGLKVQLDLAFAPAMSLLLAILTGIALQWHGIYYLYATHDPSAYLNSSLHLARTGSLFHSDPLIEKAYGEGDEALKPLLNADRSAEEWQLTRNYGVIPFNLEKGLSSFHGFYGAPLFLAVGIELFGERNALRIQWFHFIALALCLMALCELLIGEANLITSLAAWMLVLCPLVAPLYREPLSEPLAAVFFAAILFSLFELSAAPILGRFLLLAGIAAGIGTRVSGLLYLPFFFLTCAWLEKQTTSKTLNRWTWFGGLASTLCFTGLMLHFSPTYTEDILRFYSRSIVKFLPFPLASHLLNPLWWMFGALSAITVLFLLRRKVVDLLQTAFARRNWALLWKCFFSIFTLGVVIRYVRLVTKLTVNIGGYPFVLFNLDSLLFYGGPALVGFGLYFWFRFLIITRKPAFLFLQTFLPFCLFFYCVFRFLPLNLQVNFQRYLLIELIPLSIIGFVVFLFSLVKTKKQTWIVPLVAFTALWNGGILFAINHSDICQTAFSTYAKLRQIVDHETLPGKKPVIVAVSPSWLEESFLMPLSNGFDIPVTFINHPFSYEASKGIERLQELGYSPILAIGSSTEWNEDEPVWEGEREWTFSKALRDCRKYPQFGLGAPPLELTKSCVSLSFLKLEPKPSPSAGAAAWWQPAWANRHDGLPYLATHWYGLSIDGRKTCQKAGLKSHSLQVTMEFPPEANFEMPDIKLNGQPTGEGAAHTFPGKNLFAHRVTLSIPISELKCTESNTVDIDFPPGKDGTRRAIVESVELKDASHLIPLASRY